VRDDQAPEERPDEGADSGPPTPPARPVGAEDRDVLDVPEWVSEFRRLYVEPKSQEALKEQSRRAGRRPPPVALSGGAPTGSAAGAGELPEQPLADEPQRSRSEMQRERRSTRGDRSTRRDETGPPRRPSDPGTGSSPAGSRAARRLAREERARAERRMRLRRTVVVGMLLLVVAAVVTWLVARNREPVSASPAALVQPVAAAAPTADSGPASAPAAAPATADGAPRTAGGRAEVLVRHDATEPELSPDRSGRRPEADRARPRAATATPAPTPSPAPSPVARGTRSFSWVDWGAVPGVRASGGSPVRVALELEGGLGLDEAETASTVAGILVDDRGWQTERDVRFVFVSAEQARRGEYDTRIGIASRSTTTDLCAPLDTEGYTSCYNGRVVINLDRWMLGIDAYDGHLDEYRTYVVDHEVGHALGLGHAPCPAEGAPAPVMVPQTLHLWGCAPNPYPVVG
jgi:hypothetical protein